MDLKENILLSRYFNLLPEQNLGFSILSSLYSFWNEKINMISRKDMDHIEEHHFLHSLAIARLVSFAKGTRILDVGTGGGFPGIPLAILFPEAEFTLVDSIGKKIKVVDILVEELGLKNVKTYATRVENLPNSPKFDFVVSRAVTRLSEFWPWVAHRIDKNSRNSIPNGLLALKGGDLEEEIKELGKPAQIYPIGDYFQEPFFETKKIVYIPAYGRG